MTGGGGGVSPDERALKQSLDRRFFLFFFSGFWSATSPVISARPLAPKVSCEYPCCTQFHSLNELILYCLISGGSYDALLSVEGTLIARE